MKIPELKTVLEAAWRHGEQFGIVGPPGIGKTDAIKQLVAAMKYDMLITHGAVCDPTDFKGFPSKTADGTHATFLPFGELYRALNATQPTIWFWDDAGQTSEAVQKAMMQVAWGRRINGHILPDCVTICAATNDVRQLSGVGGLIEPFKSRFTLLHLETDVLAWVDWALDHGMPAELIAFMRSAESTLPDGRHILFAFDPTKEMTNSPCPRGWEKVGRRHARGFANFECDAGDVGKPAAQQFAAWLDIAKKAPSIDAILMDPSGSPIPDEPSLRYLVAGALAQRANANNMERVMRYLWRMTQPFRTLSIKDAVKRDNSITSHSAYVAWAAKEGAALI